MRNWYIYIIRCADQSLYNTIMVAQPRAIPADGALCPLFTSRLRRTDLLPVGVNTRSNN